MVKAAQTQCRDVFLFTAADKEQVLVQKIIHSLADKATKIMAKEYVTRNKTLQLLHCPPHIKPFKETVILPQSNSTNQKKPTWSAINPLFYCNESSDGKEDDTLEDQQVQDIDLAPQVAEQQEHNDNAARVLDFEEFREFDPLFPEAEGLDSEDSVQTNV